MNLMTSCGQLEISPPLDPRGHSTDRSPLADGNCRPRATMLGGLGSTALQPETNDGNPPAPVHNLSRRKPGSGTSEFLSRLSGAEWLFKMTLKRDGSPRNGSRLFVYWAERLLR